MRLVLKSANFGVSILLVVVAIVIAYIAIPAFGNKALIVRSGSMNPAIKVGDLVVAKRQIGILSPKALPLPKYQVGDIIAFSSEKNPKLFTTHRIASVQIKDDKVSYQTKGDANKSPDQNLVAEENIIGKAQFSIISVGELFAFAKSKNGFLLMVIFPALLVIVFEISNIFKELRRIRIGSQHINTSEVGFDSSEVSARSSNNAIALRILLPFVLGIMFFQNSFAYFSDTGTSNNNIFTADTCFGTGDHVVINEVFYEVNSDHNGQGSENNWEWVELFNPTSSSSTLTGWSIGDNGPPGSADTFPGSPSIPLCGFAIVSPSTEAELEDQTNNGGRWTIPDGTVFITIPSFIGNGLANGGDRVVLKNNLGTEVDRMSWGTDTTGFSSGCTSTACPSVVSGHSLERNPDGNDTSVATDFVDRNPPTPGS